MSSTDVQHWWLLVLTVYLLVLTVLTTCCVTSKEAVNHSLCRTWISDALELVPAVNALSLLGGTH
ncbi:hypothetical protein PF011_g6646 [Phytophthora fragariae]|uniref:Uncharacterized protein n=1 Tax=Phytophthora fragariae TaxID=53985 RepID=A0A6A3LDR5_9STRA|nr:hypothetical protein PF011_g6646 [Phytophthora fragariae]